MSQISSVNPFSPLQEQRQTQSAFGELSSEDFIRIMFTELTNQDPLDPSDSAALLEQLNSIRSIESDLNMQAQLESLVTENQLASASTMIGKFVGGLTEDFYRVSGYVVSVIKQGDAVTLELDNGWLVPVENVETVIDPSIFEDQIIDDDTDDDDDDNDPDVTPVPDPTVPDEANPDDDDSGPVEPGGPEPTPF